jgi:hypothetical protein
MRGRVLALQSMVLIGSTPIGGPVLGFVCDAFGARAGLVIGGVAALTAAAWGRMASKRRAALPAIVETPVEALQADVVGEEMEVV